MTYEELYLRFIGWTCDTELRIYVDGDTIDTTAGAAMEYYGSREVNCFDDHEVELEE